MLAGVARRLKRGMDDGMDPAEVFSRCQDHVIGSRPRARRAARPRGVRGPRSPRCPTGTQGGAEPALRPLRAAHDRGRPWLVDGARPAVLAAVQGDQPRGRRSLPQDAPPRPGPRRRVRRTRGAAGDRDARRTWRTRTRSGWTGCGSPGWAGGARTRSGPAFYDWSVEHPAAGGALWRLGIGSDLRRLYAAAARDRPAARRVRRARRPLRGRGRPARPPARPGRALRRRRHLPAMLDRTMAAAQDRGVGRPGGAAARRRGRAALRRRRVRPGGVLHRAALLPRPPLGRCTRWAACSTPAGS